MDRAEDVRFFWGAQKPTNQAMMLNDKHLELDLHEKQQILECLPDLTGKKVLELAAGIGRYTADLAQRAAHVTAVDIAPQLIAANQLQHAHLPNVDFVCADVMDLAAGPGSYDVVFINWLLMYLSDEETQLLAERLRSWTKRGGFVFLRESCAAERHDRRGAYYVNYRQAGYYGALFAAGFRLVGEANVLIYHALCGNPHQRLWLFQRH